MKIRLYTLPNFITLLNLLLGCAAVVFALKVPGDISVSFWLLLAAAVCDFADGMVARLTGQHSEVGVELDSLADVVSFGVAPASILWVMYRDSLPLWNTGEFSLDHLGWLVFVVAAFSALRLAKFNVDETQTTEFQGLPTPANALAVAALGWMSYHAEIWIPREFVLLLAAVSSYLLVCPLRMFSLKMKHPRWFGNEVRYVFAGLVVVLLGVFQIGGVALAVVLYILVSAGRQIYLKKTVI